MEDRPTHDNTHSTYIANYWQYIPHHQHQMTDPRQFTHKNRPYTDQNCRDKTSQFIDIQNKSTDTLYKTQLQNSMYSRQPRRFDSSLLSIEKVAKLTDSDPNKISFAKAKGNLLKFLYLLNFKGCSRVHPKEKMWAEFSKVATAIHAPLTLIHCKPKSEESLTAFIYRCTLQGQI